MLIIADSGGSNGSASRLWKRELQRLADRTGLTIHTWRAGLRVKAELDTKRYPTGIKVTDEQLQEVRLSRAAFHGEWNYSISPEAS